DMGALFLDLLVGAGSFIAPVENLLLTCDTKLGLCVWCSEKHLVKDVFGFREDKHMASLATSMLTYTAANKNSGNAFVGIHESNGPSEDPCVSESADHTATFVLE
ncbi:hypothetical protein P4O66_020010, partial [Electrophorus voltai]